MNVKTVSVSAILTFIIVSALGAFAVSTASAQTQPVTCSIYATASNGSGQPVTLSWNSNNATYAFLNPGSSVSVNGSQVVYPTVTTTYTLTVNGSQGQSGNCQTTVYVGGGTGNLWCSINAATTNTNPGSAVTLTWNSSNATSANLSNVGTVTTSGSQIVYPYNTTTYTLTVYNSLGQSSNCQTTIFIGGSGYQAPSCWINISNQYGYNNQATLTWGSTNATSASISPSVGSVSTSGSQTVYNYGNQIYTMTVYNYQGQSATCQTTTYNQPGNLSCTINAYPSQIQNGQGATLTWTSTGANSAWLSDGLGNVAPNGSLVVRPESSRNYTLTVTGYGGTQTCNTYVNVSGSYISLTQIPYTGFDMGPIGNSLFWIALAVFAFAGGYLIVYYMPLSRMSFSASRANHEHIESATIVSERVTVPALFSTHGDTRKGSLDNLPTE